MNKTYSSESLCHLGTVFQNLNQVSSFRAMLEFVEFGRLVLFRGDNSINIIIIIIITTFVEFGSFKHEVVIAISYKTQNKT